MSLIQEALKKAQGGPPRISLPLGGPRYGRGRRTGIGRSAWRLLGAGTVGIVLLFLALRLPGSLIKTESASKPLPLPVNQPTSAASTPASSPVVEAPPSPATDDRRPSSVIGHRSTSGVASAEVSSSPRPLPRAVPVESLPVVERPEPAPPEKVISAPALRRPVEEARPNAAPGEKEAPPVQPAQETIIKPVVEGKDRYHFNMGLFYQKQREYARAFEAYQRAVELNPFHVEAYNNLGILYKEVGDLDKAIQHFRKAFGVDPNYEKAYNNLGVALIRQGQLEEAADAFERALTLNPRNLESYTNLGVIYRRQNRIPEAIRAFETALAINPEHAETHYNVALLFEAQGRIPEAITHYQRFVTHAQPQHRGMVAKVIAHIQQLTQGTVGTPATRKTR